ncbi:MAG: N-formylglutamate amidohydrolase [Candidatus Aminicenantes bacterium]|nr:N-formylglutamate amidohydrolase [Candidatus Aminicenantes bacterium]
MASEFKELFVVIPHSGIVIPMEIPLDSLSDDFPALIRNVDWNTNWLYDFRDFLGNGQTVFPYCSLILEANRHPDILDESVPLKDVRGIPVYKPGREPGEKLRKSMAGKYLHPFHRAVGEELERGGLLLLDGHSTVTARGMSDSQIDLMNYQVTELEGEPCVFCPDAIVETYAEALQKRLPGVKVTVNGSDYHTTYGHICAEHSVNSLKRKGNRVPAILQETNEKLYRNPDRTPNIEALNTLRRAFAESLAEIRRKIWPANT